LVILDAELPLGNLYTVSQKKLGHYIRS